MNLSWIGALAIAISSLSSADIETRPLAGAKADVLALLLRGRDSGALPAGIAVTPVPDRSRLEFWMDLEASGLLPSTDKASGEKMVPADDLILELYALAVSSAGEIVGSIHRRAQLSLEETRERLREEGLRFAGGFDLEPGDYEIRVLMLEPKHQRFAFRVVAASLEKGSGEAVIEDKKSWLAWTPIRVSTNEENLSQQADSQASSNPTSDAATEPRTSQRIDTIREAYRAVLVRLSSGDWRAARDDLAALEAKTLSSHESRERARDWLVTAQTRVMNQVANFEAEALLPMLVIHLDRHDQDLAAGVRDPYRVNTTRQHIMALSRLYTKKAGNEMAPSLVASALAELGVALDRAGLAENGRRMLDEALATDESHVATLLYLSYWHERRNESEKAVALLRRLLAVAPRSEEGRLRLAVNLRHLDQEDESIALLNRLLRAGDSEWILTLAHEELGRVLLGQGQIAEAITTLQQGVARLPGQQRLHVQLAYLLDRGGQKQEGQDVLQNLPSDRRQGTPRLRYSLPPSSGSQRSRDDLRRHSLARLPLLAAAL